MRKGPRLNGRSLPHPIPYQGSKRLVAREIVAYFPGDVDTLIEPFAGSAAVTILAAASGLAKRFAISDSNAPLMALWDEIVSRPDALASAYAALWTEQEGDERAFYDRIRAEFNRSHRPDHLLYLLARCVKASVRYNAFGEFNQSPDNRRKGTRPCAMERHIHRTARLLAGRTHLKTGDFRDALSTAAPADLIYMDPPYQGVVAGRDRRYWGNLSYAEFVEALAALNESGLSYIVSYDGRNGLRSYGEALPASLRLRHLSLSAGRSSQATLLGRNQQTIESLYLSSALVARLRKSGRDRVIRAMPNDAHTTPGQLAL